MRSRIFTSDSTFGISNISDIIVFVKYCGDFVDFFVSIKTRREQSFIFVQEQLDTKYCFMSMTEESSSIHAEIDYAVEVNCQISILPL